MKPRTKTFGDLLKAFRETKKYTQEELGKRASLNAVYIAVLESKRQKPSRKAILSLSEALDLGKVDTDNLLRSADQAALSEEEEIGLQADLVRRTARQVLRNASSYSRRRLTKQIQLTVE